MNGGTRKISNPSAPYNLNSNSSSHHQTPHHHHYNQTQTNTHPLTLDLQTQHQQPYDSNHHHNNNNWPSPQQANPSQVSPPSEFAVRAYRIVKVRIAGKDPDFVEIDLPVPKLTLRGLIEVACLELFETWVYQFRSIANTKRLDWYVQATWLW